MQVTTTQVAEGHCYCGAVQFRIERGVDIRLRGYCHCSDCRRAHAADLYRYAYLGEDGFELVAGSEQLQWFVKDPEAANQFRRYFCTRCGTRTHNWLKASIGGREERLIGVFPSLFADRRISRHPEWQAIHHIHIAEGVLDLDRVSDGLPRYSGDSPPGEAPV